MVTEMLIEILQIACLIGLVYGLYLQLRYHDGTDETSLAHRLHDQRHAVCTPPGGVMKNAPTEAGAPLSSGH